MKIFCPLVAAVAMIIAMPASAALFVSGDSNIVTNIGSFAPNQQFLRNISGGQKVLVQDSTRISLGTNASATVSYLNGAGLTASLLSAGATITANDLLGVNLYIAFARNAAFVASEVAAINAFLTAGGNVLVTGDNGTFFPDLNIIVNDLLTSLGSGMSIQSSNIDPGFNTANIITFNAFTNGTVGFEFASTSSVSGGTALYGTKTGNTPFLAFEGEVPPAVPEPATWAMMVGGFGMLGGAMRLGRRRTTVTYA